MRSRSPSWSPALLLLTPALLLAGCTAATPAAPSRPPATSPPRSAEPLRPVAPLPAPSPSPSPSPTPLRPAAIRLAAAAPTASLWGVYAADRLGLFQKYALTVQPSDALGAPKLTEALGSPTYDVVAAPTDLVVSAVAKGGSLKIVAGLLNQASDELIVGRGIDDYAGLKGQPIAVEAADAPSTMLLTKLLAAHGLGPDDYSLVALGSADTRAAGIANQTVAGGLLDQPRASGLVREGFKSLGLAGEAAAPYQAAVVATRSQWASQNAEALERFLRALAEADVWLRQPTNRAEAASILAQATKTTPADASRAYDLLVQKTGAVPRAAEVDRAGLKTVIQFMGELGALKGPLPAPEGMIDSSHLDRARGG